MTRKGKWTTSASGLAKRSEGEGTNWEFPRKRSQICASWTELTSEGLSEGNETLHSPISKRLREL
jgi:hypothetical protein